MKQDIVKNPPDSSAPPKLKLCLVIPQKAIAKIVAQAKIALYTSEKK